MPIVASTAVLAPGAASGASAGMHYAMVLPGEIAVVGIVFGTGSALLYPLVRAWARRLEGGRGPSALPAREVEERLERIERAVESIALEVERVSEGQRFVTKLLAEKAPSHLPPANS